MRCAVKNFIEKHQLLKDRSTVVVGVSGGPDSLALLHYLWKEEKDRNLQLIVAHAEHGLRGKTSEEDLLFVEAFCQKSQIPFEGAHLDVAKWMKDSSVSVQMAAREARYRFFQEVMEKYNADFLALAQHGDDQIETMLMRQVRGTYSYGLAGIPVKRDFATGQIIRPFLGITKQQIEQYCQEEGLYPRFDESNESDKYTRNRFRKYVLPFLKKENQQVHQHFQKLSEWLAEDEDYLMNVTKQKLDKLVIAKSEKEITVSAAKLRAFEKPLQRRAIHLILVYLYGNFPPISQIHIEQIFSLCHESTQNKRITLPKGLVAIRQYGNILFTFSAAEDPLYFEYELSIPGMIDLEIGQISGEFTDTLPEKLNLNTFVCDANELSLPLTVRSKKEGDFIRPIGLNGRKKVNRLFIDRKIDSLLRAKWPVVVDQEGEILWVPGLARSNKALVTKMSQTFLVLIFKRKD